MYMFWLITIETIKKEPIGSFYIFNCRHCFRIPLKLYGRRVKLKLFFTKYFSFKYAKIITNCQALLSSWPSLHHVHLRLPAYGGVQTKCGTCRGGLIGRCVKTHPTRLQKSQLSLTPHLETQFLPHTVLKPRKSLGTRGIRFTSYSYSTWARVIRNTWIFPFLST